MTVAGPDLGRWGPRGIFFHDAPWMRALVDPLVFLGLPAVYLCLICIGLYYKQHEKPAKYPTAMRIYNLTQIVVCSYMVYGLCPSWRNPFMTNTEFTADTEWYVFVHYLTKYLDWFDTFFIVAGKKRQQLSFLHVYHHSTIGMVWGYLTFIGNGNGSSAYGAWISSLTNVVMYSHYLWTSFGLRNPFKRLITLWQISQFWSCQVHMLVFALFENVCGAPWPLQLLYQATMIYLFTWNMTYVPGCVPDLSEPPEQWIRVGDKEYNVANFAHPGGRHMLAMGIGRDASQLFSVSHIRIDVAEAAMKQLPQREPKFPKDEFNPTKHDDELMTVLKKRVRKEVVEKDGKWTARGVPLFYVLPTFACLFATVAWFMHSPGMIAGVCLGTCMAWTTLVVQHTANHGGLVQDSRLNFILGLFDDLVGGTSLLWRFHHNVSHHLYCNDKDMDQDVASSMPFVRLDSNQPWEWYHAYQHLYLPLLLPLLYFSFQWQDLVAIFSWSTGYGISFVGADRREFLLAFVLKLAHFAWLYVVPWVIYGWTTMFFPWLLVTVSGSIVLGYSFIVSHNCEELKDVDGAGMSSCEYQIRTSSSWGGRKSNWLMGGLNLQIEHHLFPSLAHHHYPAVQSIVMEECEKRGIPYAAYGSYTTNFHSMFRFLRSMGQPPKQKAA